MKTIDKRKADYVLTKSQNRMCKNAKVDMKTTPTEDVTVFEYEIINRGCPRLRRSGSAYCQQCSDDYANK